MDIQTTPPTTELTYRRPSMHVAVAANEPSHIHVPRPSRIAQGLVRVVLDDAEPLIAQLALEEAEAEAEAEAA